MKEREILRDTVRETKPVPLKVRNYKPRKKKEEDNMRPEVANSEKPFVPADKGFNLPKTVGKYCMGTGKGFCIHFEEKPNWLHRKCMKIFLGWTWTNNENASL